MRWQTQFLWRDRYDKLSYLYTTSEIQGLMAQDACIGGSGVKFFDVMDWMTANVNDRLPALERACGTARLRDNDVKG